MKRHASLKPTDVCGRLPMFKSTSVHQLQQLACCSHTIYEKQKDLKLNDVELSLLTMFPRQFILQSARMFTYCPRSTELTSNPENVKPIIWRESLIQNSLKSSICLSFKQTITGSSPAQNTVHGAANGCDLPVNRYPIYPLMDT